MFRAGRSSHFSPPVVFYHLGSLQDGKLWLKGLDNKTVFGLGFYQNKYEIYDSGWKSESTLQICSGMQNSFFNFVQVLLMKVFQPVQPGI